MRRKFQTSIIQFCSNPSVKIKFNQNSRFMFSCNSFYEVCRYFDNRNIFGLSSISKISLLMYEIQFDSLIGRCRPRYATIGQGRPS